MNTTRGAAGKQTLNPARKSHKMHGWRISPFLLGSTELGVRSQLARAGNPAPAQGILPPIIKRKRGTTEHIPTRAQPGSQVAFPPAGGEVDISKSKCKAKLVAVVGAVCDCGAAAVLSLIRF